MLIFSFRFFYVFKGPGAAPGSKLGLKIALGELLDASWRLLEASWRLLEALGALLGGGGAIGGWRKGVAGEAGAESIGSGGGKLTHFGAY